MPEPQGPVVLVIDGAITHRNAPDGAYLDRDMINQLARRSLETTTAVTDDIHRFQGVLMRDLLAMVGARGTSVQALALNDYRVDIPLSDFDHYDVLLASHMDGIQLTPADKGPFWIVYPRDDWRELQDIRYDYRWVWQLQRLTVK